MIIVYVLAAVVATYFVMGFGWVLGCYLFDERPPPGLPLGYVWAAWAVLAADELADTYGRWALIEHHPGGWAGSEPIDADVVECGRYLTRRGAEHAAALDPGRLEVIPWADWCAISTD